jgi:superfamily II RNA helicase
MTETDIQPELTINEFTQENEVTPLIDFGYTLDDFQLKAMASITRDENVLVTASTGNGKTSPALFAIAKAIKDNKKVLYTTPLKALTNQKYKEIVDGCKSGFLKAQSEDIGIMTGDVKRNEDTAQIIVMTTEILHNKLFLDPDFLKDVKYVVFDEVHYISDESRGKVWERSICMLPQDVSIIMLSATVQNTDEFAQWVECARGKPTVVCRTDRRIVPLHYSLYNPQTSKFTKFADTTSSRMYVKEYNVEYQNIKKQLTGESDPHNQPPNQTNLLNTLVDKLVAEEKVPALIFSFSRRKCEMFANKIQGSYLTHEERKEVENIFKANIAKCGLNEKELAIKQIQGMEKLLMKGVGYHTSGLLPIMKEIVEIILIRGLVKVLFATETVAVGLNVGFRAVVFTDLKKPSDKDGMRHLTTSEFMQAAGRAGRRGKDTEGHVIYAPLRFIEHHSPVREVLFGPKMQIHSFFNIDFSFILKSIMSNSDQTSTTSTPTTPTTTSLTNVIKKSLLYREEEQYQEGDKHLIQRLQKELTTINETWTFQTSEKQKFIEQIQTLRYQEESGKNHNKRRVIGQQINTLSEEWASPQKLTVQTQKQLNTIMSGQKNKPFLENTIREKEFNTSNTGLRVLTQIWYTLCYLRDYKYISFDDSSLYSTNNTNGTGNQTSEKFIEVFDKISSKSLTEKGIIASDINESNPIVMTELLSKGFFDTKTMDIPTINAVLALFVEEKRPGNGRHDGERLSISDLSVPDNVKQLLTTVMDIYKETSKYASEYELECGHGEPQLEFVEYAYWWSTGMSLEELSDKISGDGVYEGSFVRYMNKLNNILNELIECSQVQGKIEMVEPLVKAQNDIMRGIMNVESIYLRV